MLMTMAWECTTDNINVAAVIQLTMKSSSMEHHLTSVFKFRTTYNAYMIQAERIVRI
jgi:hypothetical protein